MKEQVNHPIYELLENKYPQVELDYVILKLEEKYEGIKTHKDAIIKAFEILSIRFGYEDEPLMADTSQMVETPITIHQLLEHKMDIDKSKKERSFNIPTPLTYEFAFLNPPHSNPYVLEDFNSFNEVLLKNKEDLEIDRWNDDFSNYFDAGKEWWGTGLWTIYDCKENEMIVIGASLTD